MDELHFNAHLPVLIHGSVYSTMLTYFHFWLVSLTCVDDDKNIKTLDNFVDTTLPSMNPVNLHRPTIIDIQAQAALR